MQTICFPCESRWINSNPQSMTVCLQRLDIPTSHIRIVTKKNVSKVIYYIDLEHEILRKIPKYV